MAGYKSMSDMHADIGAIANKIIAKIRPPKRDGVFVERVSIPKSALSEFELTYLRDRSWRENQMYLTAHVVVEG